MFWGSRHPVVLEGQYDHFECVILVLIHPTGHSSSFTVILGNKPDLLVELVGENDAFFGGNDFMMDMFGQYSYNNNN